MKIVYVHDALARIGGVERILTDKMNWLAENGNHDIYLVTAAQGQHPVPFPLSTKVRHWDIDARFHVQYQYKYPQRLYIKWQMYRRFKKNLKNAIEKINPDIIVATPYYKADVICQLKGKAKKIIESHCAKSYSGINDGVQRNNLLQRINQLVYSRYNHIIEQKSDMLVALTKGDAALWNTPRKCVIPNIITRIADKISDCESKRVIAIGRLTHQKGFELLIDVWKQVAERHPDWKLDIYGKGELQDSLQQQIKDNGLQGVINILPPTPHIYKELQKSSVFVLSSRYEGFGLVLIEAMTNGVPCVSFDCPYGPSEIMENGKDGFLVPNGDVQEMADKICYLIEHEEERKTMGRQARLSAMRYAPENIMPMWEKLFNEIVKS